MAEGTETQQDLNAVAKVFVALFNAQADARANNWMIEDVEVGDLCIDDIPPKIVKFAAEKLDEAGLTVSIKEPTQG